MRRPMTSIYRDYRPPEWRTLGGVLCEEDSSERPRRLPLGRENRETLSWGGCFKTWDERRAQKPGLCNGTKSFLSVKGAGTAGHPSAGKQTWTRSNAIPKQGCKMDCRSGVKHKIISFLEDNRACRRPWVRSWLLRRLGKKGWSVKERLGKLRSCHLKTSVGKDNAKRWAPDGGGIFAQDLSAKCYPKHSRNSRNSTVNKHAIQ